MKRPLDAIVADIADDVSVDWSKVGETSDSRLRQFKIIALVGAGRQATPAESRAWRAVRAVLAVAVALAAIKIVFTVLAIATTEPFRIGPKGVIVVAFGLFGGCLLWGGQRDIRALALGGLFILIGSTFGKSYLERAIGGPVGTPALWLTHLAPEAMLGAALWAFTWVFPSQPRSVVARRLGRWGIALSLSVGGAAALATTVGALVPAETFPTVAAVLRISGRGALTSMFWPVLLTSSALALPYLVGSRSLALLRTVHASDSWPSPSWCVSHRWSWPELRGRFFQRWRRLGFVMPLGLVSISQWARWSRPLLMRFLFERSSTSTW